MSARRVATLATRKAKERDLSAESLRERWIARAAEVGLDREAVRAATGRVREIEVPRVTIGRLEDALTAHASTFERRDVVRAVAESLPAGAPAPIVESLADSYLALAEVVVPLGSGPRAERYTTRRIWELEQAALQSAEEMAAERGRAVVGEIVAARVIDARPSMKPDQREMVARLLTGGEGLVVVVGEAGAGKSYAVGAAAAGWAETPGVTLRAAAPTWRAAGVLRSEGIQATSVAALLARCDRAAVKGSASPLSGAVLVVDEAGMLGTRDLARLIAHSRSAEAKLVLIGDPAQLGEIEAGGLFAALVERGEPIVLDEVIRHRHDLDREAAKMIREGEGAAAVEVYRESGRAVVCADPEQRRVEMVEDWWQSFGAGEDALMIASRNAEVARLNEMARARMREQGRLGETEIEVGGERFAAGDQVITRVNDQRARVYNRERWRIAEVDGRGAVLEGIDAERTVRVDGAYLGRSNPYDGAPALQHAYAATTYQAQGATVDRAYVMADPSMDRREIYVAASRSREETYFYAAPEVSSRAEFAPADPHSRPALRHIAEAAERDGAQVAAHDAALRGSLAKLPTAELEARRRHVETALNQGSRARDRAERLERTIARRRELLADIRRRMEALPTPGRLARPAARREHQRRMGELARAEAVSEEIVAESRRKLAEAARSYDASRPGRAETAVIDYVLRERGRAELTALRLSPPSYVVAEIGERPREAGKARAWDSAAQEIQGYRRAHRRTSPLFS